MDVLIPFDIQGFGNLLVLRFEIGFKGVCLSSRFFSLL